jgi:arsenate reductase
MITIYHNPRCSKSRACNLMLEDFVEKVNVINYTKDLFTEKTLGEVIRLLKIKPLELVRKNEQEWKDNYKGKELADNEVIKAMVKYPKLIERPIVVNGNKAAIGRPMEAVQAIL